MEKIYTVDLQKLRPLKFLFEKKVPPFESNYWKQFVSASGFLLDFFEIRDTIFFNKPFYNNILNNFNLPLTPSSLAFNYLPPDGQFPPHIDITKSHTKPRPAVIIIPLNDTPSLITYFNEKNNPLTSHHYSGATAIRTDITHSVHNNYSTPRITLQISMPVTIDEIYKLTQENNLLLRDF